MEGSQKQLVTSRNVKSVSLSASVIINLLCLSFTVWKCTECVLAYLEKPQGTKLSINYIADQTLFPLVTVCAAEARSLDYNETVLKSCGINSANEYKKKSWSGTGGLNCTDPKQLFESITKQPWELIRSIKLNFRETQNKTSFEGKSIAKAGNITDINFYGRCFSIIVSPEIQRKGVSQMIITSKAPVTILYSTPGLTISNTAKKKTTIDLGRKIRIDVTHDILNMLDVGGAPCNKDTNYNKDECILEEAYRSQAVKTYGCTTPFLRDKSQICVNETLALLTKQLQKSVVRANKKPSPDNQCLSPCSYLRVKAETIRDIAYTNVSQFSEIKIQFEENVMVIDAYYLYTEYSLVAELGGYIGLFLGVSINQVSTYLDAFLMWLYRKK